MLTIHLTDEHAESDSVRTTVMYQEELEKEEFEALCYLLKNQHNMLTVDDSGYFYEINYENATVRLPAKDLERFNSGLFEKIENKLFIR